MKIIVALLFFSSAVLSTHLEDEIPHKIKLTIDQSKKNLKKFLTQDEIASLKLDNYVFGIYESFRTMTNNPSSGILKRAYDEKLKNAYKAIQKRSENFGNTDAVPILETLQLAFHKQFSEEIILIYNNINTINTLKTLPSLNYSIFIAYDQTDAFYEIQARKLADHLKLTGCEATLISDNAAGSTTVFLSKIFEYDYVILMGTESLFPKADFKQALDFIGTRALKNPTAIIPIIFDESVKISFPNIINMSDSTLYNITFLELLSEIDPKEYYKKTVFSSLLELQMLEALIESHFPKLRNGYYKNPNFRNFIKTEIFAKSYINILQMYEFFRNQNLTNTVEIQDLLMKASEEIGNHIESNFNNLESKPSKLKSISKCLQTLQDAFSHKKHQLVHERNIQISQLQDTIRKLAPGLQADKINISVVYSEEFYLNVTRVNELINHLKLAGFNINTNKDIYSADYVLVIGTPDLISNKEHELREVSNYKRSKGSNKVFSLMFYGDKSLLPFSLQCENVIKAELVHTYAYTKVFFELLRLLCPYAFNE